jgi:epoxyqueuosine reductase
MTEGSPAPERTALVKTLALEAGFDLVGIAAPEPPPGIERFAEWVSRGYGGGMRYLAEQLERRCDARVAFPWARSLVCVALQYDTPHPYSVNAPRGRGWISRYAWGDDYHEVMGEYLERVAAALVAALGPFRWRAYVDTGPLVERAYAARAGLGWQGKNTCLIHPFHGSWLFLGELVTDLALDPDAAHPDRCGRCTACLEACPTGALVAPGVLDARRCISTLTIEEKGAIPEEWRGPIGRQVFGCDICQDVCPWNRRRRQRGPSVFAPRPGTVAPDLEALAVLGAEEYRSVFRGSPIRRAKRRGLLRNVSVALGNVSTPGRRAALERLSSDGEALVREHARWAMARTPTAPRALRGDLG